MSSEKTLLKNILHRENNNFDLMRLIAACMVIYGHANALVQESLEQGDIVKEWMGFDYSGSLAVKIFFFLSGLVVANSLLEKKSVLQFSLARFFRIWPGMMFVVLASVFVLGPWLTSLPVSEYLQHQGIRTYIYNNFWMEIEFNLPGVFEGLRYGAVNGSLWTLPYEVGAYIILLAVFVIGLHRQPLLLGLLLLLICIEQFLPHRMLFPWRGAGAGADDFGPCFAFGAMLALFKDKVHVRLETVLVLAALFFIFRQANYAKYIFYAALFLAILYVFSRRWVLGLRLPADVSYGVYLWGWPLGQVVVSCFPEMGVQSHRFWVVLLACVMGAVSWYAVEKPGIKLGGLIYRRWKNKA